MACHHTLRTNCKPSTIIMIFFFLWMQPIWLFQEKYDRQGGPHYSADQQLQRVWPNYQAALTVFFCFEQGFGHGHVACKSANARCEEEREASAMCHCTSYSELMMQILSFIHRPPPSPSQYVLGPYLGGPLCRSTLWDRFGLNNDFPI